MIASGRMLIGLLVHLKKVREQAKRSFALRLWRSTQRRGLASPGRSKRGIEASPPKSPEAKPQNILQLDGKP